MSLLQLYNRPVSTAILLLCTAYWTFLLCLYFCSPFFLYESKFCRFSLNFASLVFYVSEKVVVNDCSQLSILNKQHESHFQQSGFAVFISLFVPCYSNRLFFIRIQFKTLKLVCVISSFVQFSSRSIELILKQFLNYSAEENPCRIFHPWAFNIKLVDSLFDTQIRNCLARHKNHSLF